MHAQRQAHVALPVSPGVAQDDRPRPEEVKDVQLRMGRVRR